ncbi:MAG: arsenic resistance protein [Candidatus Freyarchaeota archaeon]
MLLRASRLISRYLPVFVSASIILGLVAGHLNPEGVKVLKPWVPIPLFFMLYPMMINVKIEEIRYVLTSPKLIISAVLLNFLVSPLLGALFANIFLSGLNPFLTVGFILKVTVPCSGMVVAWTGFAKGRIESALIIVALSFVLAIFLIPLWMLILVGSYIPIDVWMMMQKLMLIVVLPLIAGLITRKFLIRRMGEERFSEFKPAFPAVSSIGMYVIVFIAIALEAETILNHFNYILMIALGILALYPTLFVISLIYSKIVGFDYGDTIALGYAVTAKNHSITIALALTTFGGLAVLPPAFAPIIQIPLMIVILKLAPKIDRFVSKAKKEEIKENHAQH